MANTYVSLSLAGATFVDGSTLSETWTAEYDDGGNLIDIINPNLIVTSQGGTQQTTFTASNATSGSGAYQFYSQGNGGGFDNLYLDWAGETPTTLSSTGPTYTSIVAPSGQSETLASTGTVSDVTHAVTSTITGGSWTAYHDKSSALVGVENASFTVTGPQGSTTFTEGGTLPYAKSPPSSSYEIHFQGMTDDGGGYESLYLNWKSESPCSLNEGTPSLYTSVLNSNSGSNTPVRLIKDGTTVQVSTPVISQLPTNETEGDAAAIAVFDNVNVTDNGSISISATITLNSSSGDYGVTDDNGSISGTGVTKSEAGTYEIAATTPDQLHANCRSGRSR